MDAGRLNLVSSFQLIGIALIVVGSLLLSNIASFEDLVKDEGMKTPQIFIIVVGIIIFFIATLGCCGAIRENKCMLIMFAVFLLFIFVVQLAVGIYALTHKDDFRQNVEKGLDKEFVKIGQDPKVKRLFEGMERDWHCCGVRGHSDYDRIRHVVPESCCADMNNCHTRPNDYWPSGCSTVLTDFTGKAGDILGGVAIALSLIEIVGAIFALRLASKVK
ncbi:hypothetical protein RUM43_005714 [Polyplax serrata]|uniref:Tetraspanin n=1 Tax=Polyplax serrata TaxID=468196 RepID=A0AAN8PXF1_POLSC